MAPPSQLGSIRIEQVSDSVVLLSYNRPNSANSFTPQQYDDLREALVWAREQSAVNVVVV
jgi:1,4-dihydroxy-2-naphthoyl-CoA synthase